MNDAGVTNLEVIAMTENLHHAQGHEADPKADPGTKQSCKLQSTALLKHYCKLAHKLRAYLKSKHLFEIQ